MSFIVEGFIKGINLILNLKPDVTEIVILTLEVALASVLLSLLFGIPFGLWLSITSSRIKGFVLTLVNTGMGAPPVVVGLLTFLFISREGPLGDLNLIYTPQAIVIAETLLGIPVVAGLTYSAVSQVQGEVALQAMGLGASKLQVIYILAREARLGTLAALMAAFGAVISEVGAAMMVGGNIKGQTRVLTTAIVTETRTGKFDLAIALGLILFLITLAVNMALTYLQEKGEGESWLLRTWR